MRKFTCFAFAFSLLLLGTHSLRAQCILSVSPTADTLCLGDSTTISASVAGPGLFTVMGGTNNHRGNMFDLTALNTLTILEFAGSPMATTNIAVYYRVGTFVGFENNSAGWTLIGTANNVVPIGSPTPTPIPVPINITIPAGQTYGFYVTSTNTAVSLNYSNGTTLGNVYASDANLQFREGKGMEYPFCAGGSPFSPRIWNGRITYSTPGGAAYLWSTGATTPSITVSPGATTTYTVTATSGGTCNGSSTITVNAPTVDIGPDTSYCGGGSVTLDAGAASSYLWSTGDTTQTITGMVGANWAQVTDAFGCTAADTMVISQYPQPTVNLGPDTLLCGLGSHTLDAGNPGATFVWSTGGAGQTETVTASGTYDVQLTDSNGCQSADTISILIGNPAIDLGPDTTLCNAASTILDIGPGWTSILWSNGSTNSFINVNATNTYSVAAIDSVGCTTSDSILITASANPFASFTISGDAGCITASVTNNSLHVGTALWIWGDGNTSSGANPAPHTYAAPYFGDVTLIITNDCGSDTTTIPFGCVGTSGPQAMDIRVTPNPSHGQFQLTCEGLNDPHLHIAVYNLQGQCVYSHAAQGTGARFETTIDLRTAAQGTYLLRVTSDSGQSTRRIVVED